MCNRIIVLAYFYKQRIHLKFNKILWEILEWKLLNSQSLDKLYLKCLVFFSVFWISILYSKMLSFLVLLKLINTAYLTYTWGLRGLRSVSTLTLHLKNDLRKAFFIFQPKTHNFFAISLCTTAKHVLKVWVPENFRIHCSLPLLLKLWVIY